jgi:hypothetical protein
VETARMRATTWRFSVSEATVVKPREPLDIFEYGPSAYGT